MRGRCLFDKLKLRAFSANFSEQVARVAPEFGKALRLCVGFPKGSIERFPVCEGFLIWVF